MTPHFAQGAEGGILGCAAVEAWPVRTVDEKNFIPYDIAPERVFSLVRSCSLEQGACLQALPLTASARSGRLYEECKNDRTS